MLDLVWGWMTWCGDFNPYPCQQSPTIKGLIAVP
jgi:hypothetical protein